MFFLGQYFTKNHLARFFIIPIPNHTLHQLNETKDGNQAPSLLLSWFSVVSTPTRWANILPTAELCSQLASVWLVLQLPLLYDRVMTRTSVASITLPLAFTRAGITDVCYHACCYQYFLKNIRLVSNVQQSQRRTLPRISDLFLKRSCNKICREDVVNFEL